MILMLRNGLFFLGLILFGLGLAISVKVKHLGIHPWDVLNVALYDHFGLTIGTWSVITGVSLICVTFVLDRRYISLGTFFNGLLIGPIMDFFLWLNILPEPQQTWLDYPYLLLGIVIVGIGGGMYVAAGLGAGPRDGFMLSISDKSGMTVSRARIVVESLVLIIGLLLGGPVFIMSFLYTFILSPIFQRSLYFHRKLLGKFPDTKKSPPQQKEPISHV